MNFGVEIRNTVTGRAVTLIGKQAVADFLAGVDASEWEGYKCLGELPPATQITTEPVVLVDTGAAIVTEMPVLRAANDPVFGGEPVMADADPDHGDDANPLVPNPLTGSTLVVDPILPSLTEALDAFHDGAETDPPKGADSIVLFEPVDHSDTPLVGAADPFADANPHAASVVGIVGDLTLSVGDSGAGDSYLPADAAGEQA